MNSQSLLSEASDTDSSSPDKQTGSRQLHGLRHIKNTNQFAGARNNRSTQFKTPTLVSLNSESVEDNQTLIDTSLLDAELEALLLQQEPADIDVSFGPQLRRQKHSTTNDNTR